MLFHNAASQIIRNLNFHSNKWIYLSEKLYVAIFNIVRLVRDFTHRLFRLGLHCEQMLIIWSSPWAAPKHTIYNGTIICIFLLLIQSTNPRSQMLSSERTGFSVVECGAALKSDSNRFSFIRNLHRYHFGAILCGLLLVFLFACRQMKPCLTVWWYPS